MAASVCSLGVDGAPVAATPDGRWDAGAAGADVDDRARRVLGRWHEACSAQRGEQFGDRRLTHRDRRGKDPHLECVHRGSGDGLRQQYGILTPDERGRHADPQLTVPAGDVVDEVRQTLWHGRFGVLCEESVNLGRRATGVQRAPDRLLADAIDHRRPRRLDGGQRRQLFGQFTFQRAGHHHGEVGLQQEVVDRLGQYLGHRQDDVGLRIPGHQLADRGSRWRPARRRRERAPR